ncbi:MAG: nitroreductase family protein [Candidatus Bathyarchaeia archaeon]
MDVFEAIKNRRSIRAFRETKLSDEQVETLIDAARHAPSAGNIQPWEFIIVRDSRIKRELSAAALNQMFIAEAPVVIVVCANEERSSRGYGSRGVDLYCLQDTAAATENMLLAAHAMGLGACWVGAFREETVRKVLKTPSHVRPIAIIPVGYHAEKPRPRGRRSMSDIVHYENF